MEKKCKSCPSTFRAYSTLDKYCYSCYKKHHIKPKQKGQSGDPPKRVRMKKAARKRDFYKCQLIGLANTGKHTSALHVHHIIYLSQNGVDELWNLITLCDHCHRVVHSNKTYWQPKLLRIVGGSDWYSRIDNIDKLPYNVKKTLEMYGANEAFPGNRGYIEL